MTLFRGGGGARQLFADGFPPGSGGGDFGGEFGGEYGGGYGGEYGGEYGTAYSGEYGGEYGAEFEDDFSYFGSDFEFGGLPFSSAILPSFAESAAELVLIAAAGAGTDG